MHIVLWVLLPFVLYFVYLKIFMMYYKLWYYKKQGMPTSAFPWPLIGNIPALIKYFTNMKTYQESPIVEYYNDYFKG
jgi:hypothetical protein